MPHTLDIILRTVAVYGAILLGLRLAGKRQVGQLSMPDVVLILLISNAVQNAMVGDDTSLLGGIAAAITLIIVNTALAYVVSRSARARKIVEGSPVLLVYEGEVIDAHLTHERVTMEELKGVVREHGIEHIKEVRSAVLEIDGTISIVPMDALTAEPHRTNIHTWRKIRRSRHPS
jgi:uncharacterized membrane protein YcaP (DUF421 family)